MIKWAATIPSISSNKGKKLRKLGLRAFRGAKIGNGGPKTGQLVQSGL
jgi:hypothetical protein